MASEAPLEPLAVPPSLPPVPAPLPAGRWLPAPGAWLLTTVPWLLAALAFGLAYTQAPLYYSNQNQYFLHGLAQGGLGLLADDWLAQTADPTPLFSFLVALTYRYVGEWPFYLYYLGVLGIYFASLLGLFRVLHPGRSLPVRLAFAVTLALLHSGWLRLVSVRLWGVDYPWYFQAGVAGQYILGPALQPSTFGVLLVLSICLFVADRPVLAAMSAALGAVWHSTYVLSAGIIVFSYLFVLLREGRRRDAAITGIVALLLVVPVLVYNAENFAPTSAATLATALDVLVNFRIPHHCLVSRWLDIIAVAQIAWIVLGIVLARGSRLFPVLLICALATLLLSIVQVATGSAALAVLFPWRPSSWLVPIATAVILGTIVVLAGRRLDSWQGTPRAAVSALLVLLLLGLAVSGLVININGLGYRLSTDELAMMDHVKATKAKGDVYLVPVDLPKPRTSPGASSSDFKALDQRKHGRGLIPIELQHFRLRTGAPIFIDFKSIPYRDTELIAWRDRVQAVLHVYETGSAAALRELATKHRITHVVVPAGHPLKLPGELEFADEHYRIYRLAK
jgi:hypothetical protein